MLSEEQQRGCEVRGGVLERRRQDQRTSWVMGCAGRRVKEWRRSGDEFIVDDPFEGGRRVQNDLRFREKKGLRFGNRPQDPGRATESASSTRVRRAT